VSDLPGRRRLRSASTDRLVVPPFKLSTIGSRTFNVAAVMIERLQQFVEEIHRWCASIWLQLNPSKTEVIWIGMAANLKKSKNAALALHVVSDIIKPVGL